MFPFPPTPLVPPQKEPEQAPPEEKPEPLLELIPPPKGGENLFKLDPIGDDQYILSFKNKEGNIYRLPYLSNEGGIFRFGDDEHDLIFVEGKVLLNGNRIIDFSPNIGDEDYFVLSNPSTGITHIVKYDSIDTASNRILFDDLATGSKMFSYVEDTANSDILGTLYLDLGDSSYKVYIAENSYKLAVDMYADGDIDSSEVTVYVRDGIVLDLGDSEDSGNRLTLSGKDSQKLGVLSNNKNLVNINIIIKAMGRLGIPKGYLNLKGFSGRNYYWFNNEYVMGLYDPLEGDQDSESLWFSLIIPSGRIVDTLEEGEKKVYTFGGSDHKVEVLIIEDTTPEKVTFKVDGILVTNLEEGDKKLLTNGITLEIIDLINNEMGESGSGDSVKFALIY